jgi:hypothetical protein
LTTPPRKSPQQPGCPWLHDVTLLSLKDLPYYVPLLVKAPNLSAFGSASSPTLPASAPQTHPTHNTLLLLSYRTLSTLQRPAVSTPTPSFITSRSLSHLLITEPDFTVSHAELQVHFSIPCPHALGSLSLTLSLLTTANSALVRLALCPVHLLQHAIVAPTSRKRCHPRPHMQAHAQQLPTLPPQHRH